MEPEIETALPPKQLWLIPYENPLKSAVPLSRVAELPDSPGVYAFRDARGKVLYVGKSKCVRKRVNSYRYLSPNRASRKLMRLVHTAAEVTTESCATECAALLRENALLREHRPPFNSANTNPESYHYLAVAVAKDESGTRVTLRLTSDPKPENDRVFGAFKNRGMLQRNYGALLRALWLASPNADGGDYPHALIVSRLPPRFDMEIPDGVASALVRFMEGESDGILSLLAPWISDDRPAGFLKAWRNQDLESLRAFGRHCFKIRTMSARRNLEREWITPAEADDFPIEEKFLAAEMEPLNP